MRYIWQAVKARQRFGKWVETDGGLGTGSVESLSAVWEAQQVRQALAELVRRLPNRLRYVVIARYGLDGRGPDTYAKIGAALGLTGERARQLHTEALVWLRHAAHGYTLRSLLERHTLTDYAYADELAQRWLRWRGGRHGR